MTAAYITFGIDVLDISRRLGVEQKWHDAWLRICLDQSCQSRDWRFRLAAALKLTFGGLYDAVDVANLAGLPTGQEHSYAWCHCLDTDKHRIAFMLETRFLIWSVEESDLASHEAFVQRLQWDVTTKTDSRIQSAVDYVARGGNYIAEIFNGPSLTSPSLSFIDLWY